MTTTPDAPTTTADVVDRAATPEEEAVRQANRGVEEAESRLETAEAKVDATTEECREAFASGGDTSTALDAYAEAKAVVVLVISAVELAERQLASAVADTQIGDICATIANALNEALEGHVYDAVVDVPDDMQDAIVQRIMSGYLFECDIREEKRVGTYHKLVVVKRKRASKANGKAGWSVRGLQVGDEIKAMSGAEVCHAAGFAVYSDIWNRMTTAIPDHKSQVTAKEAKLAELRQEWGDYPALQPAVTLATFASINPDAAGKITIKMESGDESWTGTILEAANKGLLGKANKPLSDESGNPLPLVLRPVDAGFGG